jgi:hypothetical protein
MLQLIYMVQAISINRSVLNIRKYGEVYILIESDKKVAPKVEDVSTEKEAEPSSKKDSSEAV